MLLRAGDDSSKPNAVERETAENECEEDEEEDKVSVGGGAVLDMESAQRRLSDTAARLRDRERLRRAMRRGESSSSDELGEVSVRRRSRTETNEHLEGWHEDSTPMPRAGPGREHVRESSRLRHTAHLRALAAAQQRRNQETARVAMTFVSKLRHASRRGDTGGAVSNASRPATVQRV